MTTSTETNIIVDANGEYVDVAMLERLYGIVATNKTTVYLTQLPYLDIDYSRNTSVYTAAGVDVNGNIYEVMWDLYDEDNPCDEADACDWEHPRSVRIVYPA